MNVRIVCSCILHYFLPNAKAQTTSPAGPRVETWVEIHTTDDSADKAAGEGRSAAPCSGSFVTFGGIRIRVGMLGESVGIILDSEDATRLIFPHVISMGVPDFHTFIDRLESLMPRKKPSVQAQHPSPQTPTCSA